MAVLTAQGIASTAIELLTRTLVLPMTVARVSGSEFRGSNGDTITVRVPQPRTARTQASPSADITYDTANEVPVDVSLSHLYNGHLLSDEEAQFEIENFARQITRPQVESVAIGAEDLLIDVMDALTADISFAAAATDADTKSTVLAAVEALNEADVPPGNRTLAVSPSIATRLLSVDLFVKANESGSASALRQAQIGNLYGLNVVVSNGLATETALAYHKSGFVFANATPVAPRGARESATASSGGVGLRQIFDYIPTKLSDASVISTFAGAAAVVEDESSPPTAARFVKIDVSSS